MVGIAVVKSVQRAGWNRAVAIIAPAMAMSEDVERAGVAMLGVGGCVEAGSGIVEEDAPFVGLAAVIHPEESQIRACEIDTVVVSGKRNPCGRVGHQTVPAADVVVPA